MAVILGLISLVLLSFFSMKHPYEIVFDSRTGTLYGAHLYRMNYSEDSNSTEKFKQSIMEDAFEYVGRISNPFNAVIDGYVRDPDLKRETVLLIEASQFTMEMLTEHRRLFADFIIDHFSEKGLSKFEWNRWLTRLHTYIKADEMTLPLEILLSTIGIHGQQQPQRVSVAPVYALIEHEKKLYTKAFKPDVFQDDITPWLKKYILGNGLHEYEHVWKGLDWPDVFFMDWRKKKPQKVNRYDAADIENEAFLKYVKESLISDRYRHIGSIDNAHEAKMDVYNLVKEDSEVTLMVIEVDTITEELFLEHRYLLNSFMGKHMGDDAKRWQEGIRVVIGVRKMTIELQILLCSQLEYKKPNIYYEKPNSAEVPQVFALVEEEKSFYSMTYPSGDFKNKMQLWLKSHIPGIDGVTPEIVWEGLEWEDLERLPVNKEEMVVKVHKALNVWKGGYQEEQGETESGSSEQ